MKLKRVTVSGTDTFKLPVLKPSETKELFLKYKQGDDAARQEIIRGNLRLVLSVIKKFTNRQENLDDLFQVGCVGLLKAVDNFDPKHNVKFSTYAVPMIMGEIKRYLRDNNPIRVSRSLRNLNHRATQAKEKLTKQKSEEPTLSEIAEELGVSSEQLVMAVNASHDPISLYEPAFSDSTEPVQILDQIQDDKQTLDHWVENMALKEAIDKLPPKKRQILNLRFFQGKTQMEVSEEVNISQAQVSRLEKSAILSLRKLMQEDYMEEGGKQIDYY